MVHEGKELTPARHKQRVLLAFLLLRANTVVSTGELVDALWGETPPDTAQSALYGHVSHLRKLLGSETIETRPPGYLLRVEPEQADVTRFERLVDQAHGEDDPARQERAPRVGAVALPRRAAVGLPLRRVRPGRGGADRGAAPRRARGAVRRGARARPRRRPDRRARAVGRREPAARTSAGAADARPVSRRQAGGGAARSTAKVGASSPSSSASTRAPLSSNSSARSCSRHPSLSPAPARVEAMERPDLQHRPGVIRRRAVLGAALVLVVAAAGALLTAGALSDEDTVERSRATPSGSSTSSAGG